MLSSEMQLLQSADHGQNQIAALLLPVDVGRFLFLCAPESAAHLVVHCSIHRRNVGVLVHHRMDPHHGDFVHIPAHSDGQRLCIFLHRQEVFI